MLLKNDGNGDESGDETPGILNGSPAAVKYRPDATRYFIFCHDGKTIALETTETPIDSH